MNNFDSADGTPSDLLLESASLLSKKWHPALIHVLAEEDGLGFSDFEKRLDGISAKVLTDALEELQAQEILQRREVSQRPLRVEYSLTDRGSELAAIVESLADWGERHLVEEDDHVVLVADDDRRVATMHTTWLEDEYTVRKAHDGEETLRELDTDVDVLVLDRRMPGLSGDEVLDWIRSQGYDCRVVVVTSEDTDAEVLDMGFDEYLTKPVLREGLRSVVGDLIERADYDRDQRQYLALRSKLAVYEAETSVEELEDDDEYRRLKDRLETLRETVEFEDDLEPEVLEPMDLEGQQ